VKYERIVIIDTLYKTNYSTTDTGYMEKIGDNYPIRTYKTSFAKNDFVLSKFLTKHSPAGVLNLVGGLQAAVLIHAE
jgi:hypothetical protein